MKEASEYLLLSVQQVPPQQRLRSLAADDYLLLALALLWSLYHLRSRRTVSKAEIWYVRPQRSIQGLGSSSGKSQSRDIASKLEQTVNDRSRLVMFDGD